MVDIENAVHIALVQEVAHLEVIDGEKLPALRNFVRILVRYLPVRPGVWVFLSHLSNSLEKHSRDALYIDEYQAFIAEAQEHGFLPPKQEFIGCRGSQPHLRGFPCSLWTTFHALTISQNTHNSQLKKNDVLDGIHGFVKYFFTCTECSQHFQQMYIDDKGADVQFNTDAVLWLWKAHNKVNERLAGDLTEDPQHPKIQFPSKALCDYCFQGETVGGNPAYDYGQVSLFMPIF